MVIVITVSYVLCVQKDSWRLNCTNGSTLERYHKLFSNLVEREVRVLAAPHSYQLLRVMHRSSDRTITTTMTIPLNTHAFTFFLPLFMCICTKFKSGKIIFLKLCFPTFLYQYLQRFFPLCLQLCCWSSLRYTNTCPYFTKYILVSRGFSDVGIV